MDGDGLRDLRKRYGLTQAEVARAAGMGQPDLSAIEHDRRANDPLRRRVLVAIRSLMRPSVVLANAEVRRRLHEVLRRHGAQDIRIFGSTARGQVVARGREAFFDESNVVEFLAARMIVIELDVAAKVISDEYKIAHPGPWQALARARDKDAHHYEDIDRVSSGN